MTQPETNNNPTSEQPINEKRNNDANFDMSPNGEHKTTLIRFGNDVIDESNANAGHIELSRSNKITNKQSRAVVRTLREKYPVLKTDSDAFIVLALFAQSGGCVKSASGDLNVKAFNTTFRLADIRAIFKELNLRNGFKKYAVTNCQEIGRFMGKREQNGNLYNKLRRMYPEVTFSQVHLLSDFQVDNPDLSNENRAYIFESFKSPNTYKKKKPNK